ncbi:type VI secretion system baseplate subunit TssG, partial [Paraburkholderia lycopersici]
NPRIDPIGKAQLPSAEPFSLGQKPSLIFAPSEIADASVKNGKLHIRLYGLGMLGPNGPLPIHVTEIARERQEHRHDSTLANFLDIFHHRYLTLLYRVWTSAQSAVSLDRRDDDAFSFYTASLSGYPLQLQRKRPLQSHARLSAAPHLVREARNPDGLASTLAHYFAVPVRMEEFVFQWIALEPENLSRMGAYGEPSRMGEGAVLGQSVPDRQGKFRITIGPLDIDDYHRFTPRGDDLLRLVDLVREFVGQTIAWELVLEIKPESAAPMALGDGQRLGWSGWMGESPDDKPVVGMSFEPEQYVTQLVQNRARRKEETSANERDVPCV